jgi:outer membrane protein OmpA-like peptidoglycan-associated protein
MISIHKIVALSAFNLAAILGYAQKAPSTVKADRNFQSYSYDKAIKRYESISKKDIEVNRKLAEAYHKTGNTDKAEQYLASVANSSDANAKDVYNYFYVLRENGKYEESETWIKKYQGMEGADGRANLYASAAGAYEKLQKDDGHFSIKNLDINTDAQDFAAAINSDKVVFTSSRTLSSAVVRTWNWNNLPFLNLYEAKKAGNYELSDIKNFNKKLNAKYHEGTVAFSADGKWMAFTRDNYKAKSKEGITKLEMYYSVLKDNKWQKEVAFPFNNKDYSVGHPTISQDGKTLYFVSDMPGGIGGTDIYKSSLDENGKWGSPQNLGTKINTEGNEMFPFFHKSGVLYFSSDGHVGLGGLDVLAVQIKESGSFSKVINLGTPINTDKDDFAFVMDNEEKGGYFSSNRDGGKGDDDIYSFNVLKALKFGKQIKGTAFDRGGNILANTSINLYNPAGKIINTVTTGDNGAYSFEVETPADYKLDGKKEKYFDGQNHANVTDAVDVVVADVVLEKDPGFSLLALVTDNKTKEPLEGVTMKITDTEGNTIDYITPQGGDYRSALSGKKIGDNINYKIELKKEGYLSKIVDFKRVLDKPGEVKVHEGLDLSMGKIELGTDIGKLININPIYFDVNKFNIRPDAAIELDKIVKAMNEYPGMVIELGSHTDCRAPMAYNMSLSDKRAKSSAAYVISKGIPKERIYGKGYGESKLINGCACEGAVKSTCSDAEHQANRRTEFIIVKLKG